MLSLCSSLLHMIGMRNTDVIIISYSGLIHISARLIMSIRTCLYIYLGGNILGQIYLPR